MPGIDYRELRRQITMREVLDLIGFQSTSQHGPQLRGPCPIPACRCTSGRPFSVHLDRQVYHCFACHSHGNALDLWRAVRGLSLYHAAIDLCRALNLDPPRQPVSHLTAVRRAPRSVAASAPSRNR